MRGKDIVVVFLVCIILILIWLFINEQTKNDFKDKLIRRLSDENDEIKKAYLDLFQQYLLLKEDTPKEIIKELETLKLQSVNLSKDVHIELGSVIDNVRKGNGVKGIRELGKIIENVLKEKADKDKKFSKKPTLHNLLEHAKNCNWIKPNEYAYAELIKEIRNKESHRLNVQEKSHTIGLAIFSGIEIIYTLNQILSN